MKRQPGSVPAIMGRAERSTAADLKVGTTPVVLSVVVLAFRPAVADQNFHNTRITANGARFGRIRMAADAARPANSARARSTCRARSRSAIAQNAAAGTSLIGDTSMASTAGLVATSHAAASPSASESIRRPITNVIHTSSAPLSGVTRNIAQWPAIVFAPAISSGRPGAVTGTSAGPDTAGRNPCGMNVSTASGQGAVAARGIGTVTTGDGAPGRSPAWRRRRGDRCDLRTGDGVRESEGMHSVPSFATVRRRSARDACPKEARSTSARPHSAPLNSAATSPSTHHDRRAGKTHRLFPSPSARHASVSSPSVSGVWTLPPLAAAICSSNSRSAERSAISSPPVAAPRTARPQRHRPAVRPRRAEELVRPLRHLQLDGVPAGRQICSAAVSFPRPALDRRQRHQPGRQLLTLLARPAGGSPSPP